MSQKLVIKGLKKLPPLKIPSKSHQFIHAKLKGKKKVQPPINYLSVQKKKEKPKPLHLSITDITDDDIDSLEQRSLDSNVTNQTAPQMNSTDGWTRWNII